MKVRKLAKRWKSRPWTVGAHFRNAGEQWQWAGRTFWGMAPPRGVFLPFQSEQAVRVVYAPSAPLESKRNYSPYVQQHNDLVHHRDFSDAVWTKGGMGGPEPIPPHLGGTT